MSIAWNAKLAAYGKQWPLVWLVAFLSSIIGGPATFLLIGLLAYERRSISDLFVFIVSIILLVYFTANIFGIIATFKKHWAIGILSIIVFLLSWFLCFLFFVAIVPACG